MTARTRLVAVTHTSNIFGAILPVADITRFVHDRGARIAVDGVAYAPHRAIDVQALDVDYYAFSVYKVYGPHHAVLYGKYAHLVELANQYHYFIPPEKIPYKLQPGNPNYELSYASAGVADYVVELGRRQGAPADAGVRAAIDSAFEAIAAHESTLCGRLLEYLDAKPRARIIGPATAASDVRVPTVSFVVEGVSSAAIVRHTDNLGLGIRHGDFHSRRLVEHLGFGGPDGVVRVSMVHYNTIEEIDRLVAALDEVL